MTLVQAMIFEQENKSASNEMKKWDRIKLKSSFTAKEMSEEKTYRMGEHICKLFTQQGLNTRIYEELKKRNKTKLKRIQINGKTCHLHGLEKLILLKCPYDPK